MSKTKDGQIDMLLTYMKDDIESMGRTPKVCEFNFNHDGEDFNAFKKSSQLSDEEIDKTIKICHSRGYIKYRCMGSGELNCLTTEGQGRAISVEAANNYKEKPREQLVSIGAIHGPTQIGNNNTQNIECVFKYLLDEIDSSDASAEQKEEAKSRLKAFLEHPLTNTVIGAGTATLIALCGGA